MQSLLKICALLNFCLFAAFQGTAQEFVTSLRFNTPIQNDTKSKKQRINLPFFDDFSYSGNYPNPLLWVDSQAYINNTLGIGNASRGVAALDALNEQGRPYVKFQYSSSYADSLTSQPINLSGYNSSSGLVLSFYYQPQGRGFAPEAADSLLLFFKTSLNQWEPAWGDKGGPLEGMKQIMLPITDAKYLHANFQFRFVNIASPNINDDVWILDYVKLDAGRNLFDTTLNDMTTTLEPTSYLAPYTSMPYRHFKANQNNEIAGAHSIEVKNNYPFLQNVTMQHRTVELFSGTSLSSNSLPTASIAPYANVGFTFPSYTTTYNAPNNYSRVVFRNSYFFSPVNGTDYRDNDSIVRDVIFDNYFAYDDGSAEKSYFLLPSPNLPSKTALKFRLNQADSLQGLAVHFGAQVPSAANKYFSIVLYKGLGATSSGDTVLHSEDLFQVKYHPDINGFTTYKFANPVYLNAGEYYIGITQPANFGSDSIYYGLDVNTSANINYFAYNVDGTWYNSLVNGTVMVRPIVGQSFVPTGINHTEKLEKKMFSTYPNPAVDVLHFQTSDYIVACKLYTMDGKLIKSTSVMENSMLIRDLPEGTYIAIAKTKNNTFLHSKFIKQ